MRLTDVQKSRATDHQENLVELKMNVEEIVDEMKKFRHMPDTVTFVTNKSRNMARAYGFKNDRFDSVAIVKEQGKIKLMLIMLNRLVFVPKFGYIGVRSFGNVGDAANELIRLTKLR